MANWPKAPFSSQGVKARVWVEVDRMKWMVNLVTQEVVGAVELSHTTIFQHQDLVVIQYRVEPMSYSQDGAARELTSYGFLKPGQSLNN